MLVSTKVYFCRDKHVLFVATKMMLVAAPASDTEQATTEHHRTDSAAVQCLLRMAAHQRSDVSSCGPLGVGPRCRMRSAQMMGQQKKKKNARTQHYAQGKVLVLKKKRKKKGGSRSTKGTQNRPRACKVTSSRTHTHARARTHTHTHPHTPTHTHTHKHTHF